MKTQRFTPGETGVFEDTPFAYDEMKAAKEKAATDRIRAVKSQDVFAAPTADDVMSGFAMSNQGKAAAALDKKKKKPGAVFLAEKAKGKDVEFLQEFLKRQGHYAEGSDSQGTFGANTRNAVIEFQKKHGLVPDGLVGKKTMAKLQEVQSAENLAGDYALAASSTPTAVMSAEKTFGPREPDPGLAQRRMSNLRQEAAESDDGPGSITVTRFAEDGVTPEETFNVVTESSSYFPALMNANLPTTVINQMYDTGMLEKSARDRLLSKAKGS
jgi:peptidoglycan hydrolase-like protein with peptidoglycan-binding domain